jgi:hypothetical protein
MMAQACVRVRRDRPGPAVGGPPCLSVDRARFCNWRATRWWSCFGAVRHGRANDCAKGFPSRTFCIAQLWWRRKPKSARTATNIIATQSPLSAALYPELPGVTWSYLELPIEDGLEHGTDSPSPASSGWPPLRSAVQRPAYQPATR